MTIGVDIDHHIHDTPPPGALDGLRHLMTLDAVYIHTRLNPEQVKPWLRDYGFDATTDERCSHCNRGSASYRNSNCPYCDGSGLLAYWWARGQLLVTRRRLAPTARLADLAPKETAA